MSKASINWQELTKVFGRPSSPNGAKPEVYIDNERLALRKIDHPSESAAVDHSAESDVTTSSPQDDSAQPVSEAVDGAPEPKDIHHGDAEDGNKKERHAGSHLQHNADQDDDNWWPYADDDDQPNDNGDGEGILESRFGGPELPSPPPLVRPDVNAYQQRKNLAHGMMDLALLSANANQLRYVMESFAHPYYYPSIAFISLSIIVQTVVGVLLILNSQYDVTKPELHKAIRVNNVTVMGVFLVTICNVFIAAFSVAPPATHTPTGDTAARQAR